MDEMRVMTTKARTTTSSLYPLFLCLSLIFACNFLAGCNQYADGTALDGVDETSVDIGSADSSLSETRPVELPVTIAKLESPNARFIVVEFVESGIELSDDADSGESGNTSGFIIRGDAGAVNVEQSTKIYALNLTTDVEVIVDGEADGSFKIQITANESDTIAFASMLEEETLISEPLFAN